MRILVATRSEHKLAEIQQILADVPGLELIGPVAAGLPEEPEEEEIEAFESFEENALAKARYFAGRSGLPTISDDSGLVVPALGGAPGVRSKRFSGRSDLRGAELDAANNRELLAGLEPVPDSARVAHYRCVLALVTPEGTEHTFDGRCDGVILRAPRGTGGFGYDPLFHSPEADATFAEIPAERKNRLSHRARAVRALRDALLAGELGTLATG